MILFFQILSGFLFIILSIGIYSIVNLLKKLESYEDVVEFQQTYLESISNTILESRKFINTLDEKGIFQSDDEVGLFFNGLKSIQQDLNKFIIETNNASEEKK